MSNYLLTKVILPTSLTRIGNYSFYSCRSLQSIKIPKYVQFIGKACFNRCTSLKHIKFEQNCELSHLSFSAFYKCFTLESFHLPTTVSRIDSFCFFKCENLTSITLPSSLKHLGYVVFKRCFSLQNIIIENGLLDIGKGCFSSCTSLQSICIPNSVSRMEGGCFLHCKSLTSLTLSSSLKTLHVACIDGCTSLKQIYIGNKRIKEYPFDISYKQSLILNSIGINTPHVIFTSHDIPPNQSNIEVPNGVIVIDDNCFRNNRKIDTVTINDSIKLIGKYAFKSSILLQPPNIPNGCVVDPTAFEDMKIVKNKHDFLQQFQNNKSTQLKHIPNNVEDQCSIA
ncbi:leucine rich repeat protein, bspa family protein [Entamoeba histolytica HM-3:IMSS]|nr:leucine rich repeat protein, bspa family protein [Entamoeba histolytica HM-3:IMSS]